MAFFRGRHFSLSSAGNRLPFVLANVTTSKAGTSVLQNYLLVLPSPLSAEEMKEPCRVFASELKEHWRIRILDVSDSMPERIPCGSGPARGVVRVIRGSEMDAVKRLGEVPGWRVILYLTSQGHVLEPALQKAANEAGAMIYDVGGQEAYFVDEQVYPPVDIPFAETHSGPAVGPSFVAQTGIARPERSISSALHDAKNGARGFYVLTTRLPRPMAAVSLRLKAPGRLNVAAYISVEQGKRPQLVIVP